MSKSNRSTALQALTAAAMALPVYQDAAAVTRDEQTRMDLRASNYSEDALAAEQTSSDVRERYDINVGQFRLTTPVGERWAVSFDAAYETMSGASPWYVEPDAEGRPVQVMSGATIDDARTDLALGVTRYADDGAALTVTAGVSTEDDYQAINAAVERQWEAGDGLTTYTVGGGVSVDSIMPTDSETRFASRPDDEDKRSATLLGGLSRILGKKTVGQSSLSVTHLSGYLSDPYKLAFVDGSIRQEERPDGRWQIAWVNRLRHRFAGPRATLHLDYRLYADDWDIVSHTVDLAWYQDIGVRMTITPSVRYYSQSQAFFYRPFFPERRDDNLYSSDYRLSPYGAITLGLAGEYRFDNFTLTGTIDRYDSSGDYAAGTVTTENPGLVDFTVAAVGVRFTF